MENYETKWNILPFLDGNCQKYYFNGYMPFLIELIFTLIRGVYRNR